MLEGNNAAVISSQPDALCIPATRFIDTVS
jgi:hypothetical protein